jgi:hypothetical protein
MPVTPPGETVTVHRPWPSGGRRHSGWGLRFVRRIAKKPGGRSGRGGAMDEFAYLHQMDVARLMEGALFMMLWVGCVVAIDYWVRARRSDTTRRGPSDARLSPSEPGL